MADIAAAAAAATATAEHQRIVPINPRAKDERERGAIQYIQKGGVPSPKGLFSFSYYYRHKPTKGNRNVAELTHKKAKIYIQGLMAYLDLVTAKGGPFQGWGILIYTDTTTLEDIEKLRALDKKLIEENDKLNKQKNKLIAEKGAIKKLPGNTNENEVWKFNKMKEINVQLDKIAEEQYNISELLYTQGEEEAIKRGFQTVVDHPSCILAVCSWPEYSPTRDTKKIDGTILRVFRHKAMMDFPDIPVCIRDADTYFTNDLEGMERTNFVEKLTTWEALLLDRLHASGKRLLLSGVPSYKRGWHKNLDPEFKGSTEETGEGSGLLAGLVTSLGGIPQWASGQLWNDSVSFIRRRCYIKADSGEISDLYSSTYVGKDEQVIVFIWLPELIDTTFFFYFDFSEGSLGGEGGHYATSWFYDKKRYSSFQRGVLDKLRESYPDAFLKSDGSPITDAFESPLRKIRYFHSARPQLVSNAENSDDEPSKKPTETEIREFKAKVAREFKKGVERGKLQEDNPIRDYIGMNNEDYGFLNPYIVTEAFRNPIYNDMMTLYFKTILDTYSVLCKRRKETREARMILSGEGGGGPRSQQQRRTTRRLRR